VAVKNKTGIYGEAASSSGSEHWEVSTKSMVVCILRHSTRVPYYHYMVDICRVSRIVALLTTDY
jgi:hypothetical protein